MKKMKRLFVVLMLVVMCLSLVACGGDDTTTDPADGGSANVATNDGSAEISDEQVKALAEAYNVVAPLYNEAYVAAEANGWLADETVATEIETLNATLGVIGTALTEDLTMLDGSDFDALPGTLLQFEAPLQALIEKVSVPYEG